MYTPKMFYGLESIDFNHNSKLPQLLEAEVTRLVEIEADEVKDFTKLTEIIRNETGMNLKTVISRDFMMACLPPLINKTNTMFVDLVNHEHGQMSRDTKKLLKTNKVIDLEVDPHNITVKGKVAELEVKLFIGTYFFNENIVAELNKKAGYALTPRMITAFIMHEIGHLFSSFLLIKNVVSTNYIIKEITDRFKGTSDKVTRLKIAREATDLGYPIPKTDEISNANEKELHFMILRETQIRMKSDMGYNLYDVRGFEALADQFSTRMGFGADLSKGLLYLDKQNNSSSKPYNVFMSVLLSASSFIITPVAIACFVLAIFAPDTTYDDVKRRPEVIRQQLTRSLKEKKFNKEEVKDVLAQIDEIEAIWNKYTSYEEMKTIYAFVTYLANLSSLRNMKLQKRIEDLANNRYYEISLRLEA